MSGERLNKLLGKYQKRYKSTSNRKEISSVLDEFCRLSGYHRKYAISLLRRPETDAKSSKRSVRGVSYSAKSIDVIEKIWKAADYPWSSRLKPMLPQWLPWAKKHIPGITKEIEEEILSISARQIDRRLGRLWGQKIVGSSLTLLLYCYF